MDYGNGTEMNVGNFNSRLQATTFNVKKGTTDIINKTYSFHNDGQVKLETDNLNSKFDRSYMFDHVGRIQQARSGAEATGGTSTPASIPYTNDFEYNAFGNQTVNEFTHYSRTGTVNDTYTNNRLYGATYDADGNQLVDPTFTTKSYYYDAANNLSKTQNEEVEGNSLIIQREFLTYDGDGYLVKTATSTQVDEETPETDAGYSIRSSLLKGEVISGVAANGTVGSTYVRANGTVVAMHAGSSNPVWMHKDPNLKSMRSTDVSGNVIQSGYVSDAMPKELDVTGNEAGFEDPYLIITYDPDPGFIMPFESFGNLANGQTGTYTVDGMQVPKNHFDRMTDFAFQGFFGMLERQARISVRDYSVKLRDGNKTYENFFATEAEARDFAFKYGQTTAYRNNVVSDTWAMNMVISNQSFQPQRQTRDTPETIAQKALNEASARLLAQGKCRTAIEDLVRKAALQKFKELGGNLKDLDSKEVMDQFNKSWSTEAVMEALNSASPVYKPKDLNLMEGSIHGSASISRPGGKLTLTFYAGFYGVISDGKTGIRVNDERQDPYVVSNRSLDDQVLSVIHEGLHAISSDYSDGFLGRIIKGKDKDLSLEEGSKAVNNYVKEHCR